MIIQSGEVGFVTRIRGGPFKINGIVIDRIANNLENRSKPICVDVFSSNPVNYDIKSLSYSVIYYMSKDTFEKSLRAYPDDF